jgi:YfiH family protein
VSQPPFDSLNLGLHVNDKAQHVIANRKRLTAYLPKPAVWLNQVHSAEVVTVDNQFDVTQVLNADALFTRLSKQPLAIMTADCLPLLLTSNDGDEIAAVHGGWRGLEKGIIGNTVNCFAAQPNEINAWLGPAIGPSEFEVGKEVFQVFKKKHPLFIDAFSVHTNTTYLANIYQIARIQLRLLGITNITGGQYCTVLQSELFFSYRRDKQTGRMATLIWRN